MSEWRTSYQSGRYLIGMGSKRRLTFLFLSYFSNKAYFQNVIWGPFRASQMFFGIKTSRFETTGLTWSNMERIPSRYALWYILLMYRLKLSLDYTHQVWWQWSSSSAPWAMMGYYPLISIIHTFFLDCVGSWWLDGEFFILSTT